MSTWSRTERTHETIEYSVPTGPWGACWNQVQQAMSAALEEVSSGMDRGGVPSDDAIRVHARDDAIVISFDRSHGPCVAVVPTASVEATLLGTSADPEFRAHAKHTHPVADCGYCPPEDET